MAGEMEARFAIACGLNDRHRIVHQPVDVIIGGVADIRPRARPSSRAGSALRAIAGLGQRFHLRAPAMHGFGKAVQQQHQRRARFAGGEGVEGEGGGDGDFFSGVMAATRVDGIRIPPAAARPIFRKYEITDSAVMRPVLGLSDGTFSIDIENAAESESISMRWVLRVSEGRPISPASSCPRRSPPATARRWRYGPTLRFTRNTHRIEMNSDAVSFSMSIENVPSGKSQDRPHHRAVGDLVFAETGRAAAGGIVILAMSRLEQITIAPPLTFDALVEGHARRAAGAAAARLCRIHALLARAGGGAGGGRLSRGGADPARLFARSAAGTCAIPRTITSSG